MVRPAAPFGDTARIPRPAVREFSESHDLLKTAWFDPIERSVGVARALRRARGRGEARNLNAWDDVENSSWFEHRNGERRLTLEQVRRGAAGEREAAFSGTLTVVAPKRTGVTPGFRVRDSRGQEWQFKLDPPDSPELASATEAIATRLAWAAGYHTAEVHVVWFEPDRLVVAPTATMREPGGAERAMTRADLDAILSRGARGSDGRVRASASRWMSNRLGSFKWEGRRDDDPNDLVPHQHRRELRGFYVVSSWLNHVDSRRGNTFDQFIGDSTGYVRHVMQDLSSTLGSGSDRLHTPMDGAESLFDFRRVAARALSLGLYRAGWELADTARPSRSIGHFSADGFDPASWTPARPNPAFAELTDRDAYWGAKLVASFTEEQLRAAVAEGHYSDPRAEAAILTALVGRRRAILRTWFSRVTPVERVSVSCAGDRLTVSFSDLLLEHGLADSAETRYSAELRDDARGLRVSASGLPPGGVVLPGASPRRASGSGEGAASPAEAWIPTAAGVARLSLRATGRGRAGRAATVYLLTDSTLSCYRVAGLAH